MRRHPVRAARRAGAARRRLLPGGRRREGGAGRGQWRRQDNAPADRHRRADPTRGHGLAQRRPRCDAAAGEPGAHRLDGARPAALGGSTARAHRGRARGRDRAGAHADRRREDADALRGRAVGVRRRRGLRRRGALGHLLHRGPRRPVRALQEPGPVDAVRRRAEAAGPRGAAARTRRGAAARRAGQLPRRPGQAVARAETVRVTEDGPLRQPRPGAAQQHRHPGGHGGGAARRQRRVDASGRVHVLPPGQSRPVRPAGGAAAALGRGPRQAQGARAHVQAEGRLQRRSRQPLPGGEDPPGQVRGDRAAGDGAQRAAGHHATQGRSHRQARRDLRAAGAHRPHAAVRSRGLVRRAGGRARVQRFRQVALPAAARGRRVRSRRGAPTGRGHPHRTGAARRPRAAGSPRTSWVVRADAHPPGAARPDAPGDPAPRRRPPRRDGSRAGGPGAGPLRARRRVGADLRVTVRRPAGAPADPAARAVGCHPAAARRAHGQPGRAVRRSARGRPRTLRRHRHRSHPRSLVRPRVRPVPRLRRRRVGVRVGHAGVGRGTGRPRPPNSRMGGAELTDGRGAWWVVSPSAAGEG